MKTIKQILKGCGKVEYFSRWNCDLKCRHFQEEDKKYYLCDKCEKVLKQTKAIRKMIEGLEPKEIEYESFDSKELIYYFKKEILSKIEGGKKK